MLLCRQLIGRSAKCTTSLVGVLQLKSARSLLPLSHCFSRSSTSSSWSSLITTRRHYTSDEHQQATTNAQQLFIDGNEAFKKNNLETAVDKYTQLLTLIENNEEYNTYEVFSYVLMTRSEAYKKLGEFDKAVLDLTDCIEKKDESDEEHSELLTAAYLSRAKLYVIKDQISQAASDCSHVERLLDTYGEDFAQGVADQIQHQLDGLKILIKEAQQGKQ